MCTLDMMDYLPRLVDKRLRALLADLPAVSIVGPRACGKTTTARRQAGAVVRLDRPAEAVAFEADPDVALRGLDRPVLLDEWQEVPEVLGAVKRSVDAGMTPGSYILTGSVRAELDATTWPGTGRVVRLQMGSLTMREITRRASGRLFLDRLEAGDLGDLTTPEDLDLADYLDLAATGGFPDPALRLKEQARKEWLESYLEQLVTRDAPAAGAIRDPQRFRRYLEAQAVNTAGIPSDTTIAQAIGADRRTVAAYERLLANLLLLDLVPAWSTNRLARLARSPKRYVVDPALVLGALRMDADAVLRDGDLMGRVLDTFVAAQLRPELAVATSRPRCYHLRERAGTHEIDLLFEFGGQRVAGLEIKATAAPRRADARHLEWLQDRLGDRFSCGVVLHTGTASLRFSDRIWALPISAIWR